ncbi:hypothetical protein W911_16075 [Hyphomicrobium nitrativorans NL23]|uniref:UrcA family protein n=1 Tax=Hyphomicrobium nitrativorans NL23 TaxID=1029756 RepID=V5SIT6_9HYPH|nr:hypothetical protein [Hyphomicrobium nitrativorans]AHB50402.1 hypothetical protein W911_16075 [Hyphomicrobium nitrativorans NL23]
MAERLPILALCVAALLAVSGSPLGAEGGRGNSNSWGDRNPGSNSGHRPGRERGGLVIEPYIDLDLSRPRQPDRNAPETMMANIEGCAADGVRLFVDCLRGRASPVAIRRLEACLRSESIPDDLRRVSACLPR